MLDYLQSMVASEHLAPVVERRKRRRNIATFVAERDGGPVHAETYTELVGAPPTTFAEFARRNAGAFRGESVYVGLE
jgi:hypothetical protein